MRPPCLSPVMNSVATEADAEECFKIFFEETLQLILI